MNRIPIQLRLASTFGIIGGGVGSLIGAWFASDFLRLATGFLIGSAIGFICGYRLGGKIKTAQGVASAELFSAGVNISALIMSVVFLIAGLLSLVWIGWNITIFASTLFFLLCALYLGYKGYHSRKI